MSTATTAGLVAAARDQGVGVAAINVVTLEHAEAVAAAADRTGLPVILQISENTIRFHGRPGPLVAACAAVAASAAAPVALHLDHLTDLDLLHWAAGRVSSVMYDASALDDEANRDATRAATSWAHDHGLFLEAELGEVGGKDGAHAPGARTDPAEAERFVAATGVDALAVAVGSSHAMATRRLEVDLELVRRLKAAVPVPLVLHGSSGVTEPNLRSAVAAGLVKINVGTVLNRAYTGAVRGMLTAREDLVDPRPALAAARTAMVDTTAVLLRLIAVPG